MFFIRTKAVIAATASLACKQRESRIRLVVLLTAPKIFAISSVTDKNSCRNFARLSAWWFDWVGHPHPKRKLIQSVLINGMCNFKDGTRAATAASKSSVGLDVKYENAWRFVAQLPRRRSGIIREKAQVMSRPSVVPRYAVAVGSLARGNGNRENT